MTDKEKLEKAFIIANNLLYFDGDTIDWRGKLWQIIKLVRPELKNKKDLEFIDLATKIDDVYI